MAELKVTLNQPVTTLAKVESEVEVTEVAIKRIVILPELNTMRVIVDVAGNDVPFVVDGGDYATVVQNCNVPAIVALLQTKLEATIADNV